MLPREEVHEILDNFAKTVISQARRNMTLQSIGLGQYGKLYNSFERDVKAYENSIDVNINSEEYNEYGKFVNYGVKGIENGKSLLGWSFRSQGGIRGLKGMPPPSAFKRDKLGRIVSDSQAFATAVTVFKKGLEPTEFFTRPFESAFQSLPEDIIKAYGLDLENFIEFTLNK